MNDLQVFSNIEFGNVRAILKDSEAWFVGKDITTILGYQNASKALMDHVDTEDKLNNESLSSLGQRGGWLINESGLYSLVLSSKLPTAKKFKHWITSEVLPSIRKHGAYMTEDTIEKALTDPDFLIKLATNLKEEKMKRAAAEQKVQVLTPKAQFYDTVAGSTDAIAIGDTAKTLNMGIGRNKLFQFLRDRKILMYNNRPYQRYIDCGYFRVIEQKYNLPNGDTNISFKTLIYQKGLDYIRKILTKHGYKSLEKSA